MGVGAACVSELAQLPSTAVTETAIRSLNDRDNVIPLVMICDQDLKRIRYTGGVTTTRDFGRVHDPSAAKPTGNRRPAGNGRAHNYADQQPAGECAHLHLHREATIIATNGTITGHPA